MIVSFGEGRTLTYSEYMVTEQAIQNPLVMSGSSDGGAHLASFVGADYTTRLLTDWVPGVLSLEQAISRLTSMPATVHGLRDRGGDRPGKCRDLRQHTPFTIRPLI